MKQGTANSRSGETKREPISHAVNISGVSQIGCMTGTARSVEPLYAGRGYEAPKAASTSHPSGSQGKHR